MVADKGVKLVPKQAPESKKKRIKAWFMGHPEVVIDGRKLAKETDLDASSVSKVVSQLIHIDQMNIERDLTGLYRYNPSGERVRGKWQRTLQIGGVPMAEEQRVTTEVSEPEPELVTENTMEEIPVVETVDAPTMLEVTFPMGDSAVLARDENGNFWQARRVEVETKTVWTVKDGDRTFTVTT